MAAFFPQEKINDPALVFGREEELRILADQAESGTMLQIIGARRFGKTTIALCLENLIRKNSESVIYPIYTDLKSARIKGTANFYRYLIAMLVTRLTNDRIFRSRQKFGMISVKPNAEYIKVFSELELCPDNYMADAFVKITRYFADKMQKTILVIFDEFEYLASCTFEKIDGFFTVRDFSSDRLDSGLCPFKFWLMGARPWGFYVEENQLSNALVIGGSGEFNNVEDEVYLSPISKDAFLQFWKTRCDEYYGEPVNESKSQEKAYLAMLGEQVYDSVSGVIFYGSALAKHIKAHKSYPDYTIIKSHLDETLRLFNDDSIKLLRSLCTPHHVVRNDTFDLLNNYGLIKEYDNGECGLSLGFLRDYLMKKYPLNELSNKAVSSNDSAETLERAVDRIDEVIENINETCRNKNRPPIFAPSSQDRPHRIVMKRVCTNEEEFGKLVEVLVKIYYERSKAIDANSDAIPGLRLAELEPYGKHAYKSRRFFKILEPLRTYYAGHLRDNVERKPFQMGKGQALYELQGHKNEPDPDKPEQWFELQIKLLQCFMIELNTVKQKVNNLP